MQPQVRSIGLDPIYLSEAYLYRNLDHDQDGVKIEVPNHSVLFFRKKTENSLKWNLQEWQNQTLTTWSTILTVALIVDNGATTTLSNSLFNMSHVHQCSVKIMLAKKFQSRQLTADTNHISSRMWQEQFTSAQPRHFFVPDLQHDLLGGRALVTANYLGILDKDPKKWGNFPVTNGE